MAGNPLVRPGMNAPGEGVFLIVRQPVEDIERGGKQDFRQQALVHPFVLAVEQLHRRSDNSGSAFPWHWREARQVGNCWVF
jgi:hypothetical protein